MQDPSVWVSGNAQQTTVYEIIAKQTSADVIVQQIKHHTEDIEKTELRSR